MESEDDQGESTLTPVSALSPDLSSTKPSTAPLKDVVTTVIPSTQSLLAKTEVTTNWQSTVPIIRSLSTSSTDPSSAPWSTPRGKAMVPTAGPTKESDYAIMDKRARELIRHCRKNGSRENITLTKSESLSCNVCSLASISAPHRTKVGPGGFELLLPCKALKGRIGALAVVRSSDLANTTSLPLSVSEFSSDTGLDASRANDLHVILVTDVVSIVLALQDTGAELFSFQDNPIELQLQHNQVITGKRACTFWKITNNETNEGVWSSEGCTVAKESANSTTCSCNHLTSFAVLMQLNPNEESLSPGDEKALNILSILGGSLSIACLTLTLVIYAVLKMYKTERGMVHANLSVALLVSQLIFLTGIDARVSNKTTCKAVAVLLHYFLLASFSWMLIEGALLLVSARFAFHREVRRWKPLLAGWGTPAPLLVITLVSAEDSYGTENKCWLSGESTWAFIAPVIFVMVVNVVFLIGILEALLKLQAVKRKSEVAKIRIFTRALLIVQPVMGFTWLFGLGINASGDFKLVFYYLFVILNSSQGVFVFVLHCLNTEEVQQAFGRIRRRFASPVKPHASTDVKMISTRGGNTEIKHLEVTENIPEDDMKLAWM
ncbi:adhesion G-protein coupled receptor D1-like [Acanthaster planci]|uniref:Adhesion G-protein coupled receptor D1-like n=1 Tax=Acanthaster planci TaxID=133434 RepID=A0A8B7ZFZ9_ACAPL|nr:adhesion G-protein coupled receptor D1-like [Acanthaster planci]